MMDNSSGLIKLSGSTWVLPGPTNIGFVERDREVYLIDSGNDKESGRKINKILKEMGWRLKGIINTHSNADHIGGNDYLQRNLDCEIWSPEIETVFVEFPEMESAFLWGGFPIKDLNSKFFQAKPSKVTDIIKEENYINRDLKAIKLPGHFFNMTGIETGDRVVFLADCLFGDNILSKYKIPFIYDVAEYKETIRKVMKMDADYFVPSHGEIVKDITETAELNLSLVEGLENTIMEILQDKMNYDLILKNIADKYEIRLDFGQYALVGSTIRSFLSYMYNIGEIKYVYIDNIMYWERC